MCRPQLQRHLRRVAFQTVSPITVQAESEPLEKSARAKAMQDAVKAAEQKLKAMQQGVVSGSALGSSTESGGGGTQAQVLGMQAAVSVLRKRGSLAQKKVAIKKGKDDKALTASEMKRLGKHLLR